jgi:hypothetical protein
MSGSGSGSCSETTEDIGSPVIVGVEGAFTGIAFDPDTDPTGLGMLLAKIDGRFWPLSVCGDSGAGGIFNDPLAKNLDVPTSEVYIDPIDKPITAHACLLPCDYRITTGLGAQVIVAKIDGVWNILRVLNSATTVPVTGSDRRCRCCGLSPQTVFRARIIEVHSESGSGSGSGGCYPPCTEFILKHNAVNCDSDPANPLSIEIGCDPLASSTLQNVGDWTVTVCGVEAEITSLECAAPVPDCEPEDVDGVCVCVDEGTGSGSGSGSGGDTRFEMYIRTHSLPECGGCDYTILIYTQPDEEDPCALEDVPIDIVRAEACGIPDLPVGTRVIMVKVPQDAEDESVACEENKWWIVRSCYFNDCADNCDPPPPPVVCCGVLCQDLPATMTATLEYSDCICDPCTFEIIMDKRPCEPGSEVGIWSLEAIPEDYKCETDRTIVRFDSIEYYCGGEGGSGSGSGSIDQEATLILNGVGGTLIESSCNPQYAVFEFDSSSQCIDKFPGMEPIPFPYSLNCKVRVTVTE